MATSIDPEAVSVNDALGLIKTWLNDHKYTIAQTIEMEGQSAVRKASGKEMLMMLVNDLIGYGISAGISYLGAGGPATLPGDTVGADGVVIAGPLTQIFGNIGDKVTTMVQGWFGAGGTIAEAYSSVSSAVFQNPLTAPITEAFTKLADLAVDTIKADVGGLWKTAIDNFHDFTNVLSGVTVPGTEGYSLGDAITAAGDYAKQGADAINSRVMDLTGIKKFSIVDLAGSLTKDNLMKDFNDKLLAYQVAKADPLTTPQELAAKELEVDYSAVALNDQVALDKSNYAYHVAQSNALDVVTKTGTLYNSMPDEYKSLYASTLQDPGIATGLSDNLNTAQVAQQNATANATANPPVI